MTEQQWWKELEGKLPDDVSWAGFADWLEDQGDVRYEIAREVYDRKLAPLKSVSLRATVRASERSFDWRRDFNNYRSDGNTCVLPLELFNHLTGWCTRPTAMWREYRTPLGAYQDLLNAYANWQVGHSISPT